MDSSFERRGLAVVRVNMRRDRTPLTGPAAWFVRFAGVYGIVCPLGFGGYTIPSIVSVAQGHGIIYVWGSDQPRHRAAKPVPPLNAPRRP
jgi:hypothetical protein